MATNATKYRVDAQPKAGVGKAVAIGVVIIALYLMIQDWASLVVWIKSPFNGI